jgi:multidrug efflux system membrane fusion protein
VNDLRGDRCFTAGGLGHFSSILKWNQESKRSVQAHEAETVLERLSYCTIKLKAISGTDSLVCGRVSFVNVRLLVDTRKQAWVIPSSAVSEGPNGDFVYVINADLIARCETVKTGIGEVRGTGFFR